MKQKYFATALLTLSLALFAQGKSKEETATSQQKTKNQSSEKSKPSNKAELEVTNLHDFMEDYTKPAMKYFKKTRDKSYLTRILKEVPALAIEEEKADWQKIVDESLANDTPENSCKSCHDLYKKSYKKSYRKREIKVPISLVGLDQEIRKKK